MANFRLKRIGLALCLMASLFIGHASACTCLHHDEVNSSEINFHSHHESAEKKEISETVNTVDDDCICIVEQPSPYAAPKPISKEFKSNIPVANSQQIIPDTEFIAVMKLGNPPDFDNDLAYSNALKTLLPARAPPRL